MTSSRVSAPLIEARNITKHYDGFTLQGVSLTVEPGQIVGFIGQNGAGKSTTIKALLGIIGIDAGDARILGVDARGLSGADAAVKERVGVVFDTVFDAAAYQDRRGRQAYGPRVSDLGRARVRRVSSSVQARFEEGD